MFETTESATAFARYEAVRRRLPSALGFPATPQPVADLGALADTFDAFVFDSFGVLNVGQEPIDGAAARIAALRAAGKRLLVLTNAANVPLRENPAKYRSLGFDFAAPEIISSRAALAEALTHASPDLTWAVAAPSASDIAELPARTVPLGPETAESADAIILLSRFGWTHADTDALSDALARRPRPVWCGNPDLVAPFDGDFTLQPGWDAHALADALDIEPVFFGKPYGNAFDLVRRRLPPGMDPAKVLMLGDTLHTDILGGAAAGFKTALVTAHGVLKNMDVEACMAESGIVPDYILPAI